jgi:hypothetical protein
MSARRILTHHDGKQPIDLPLNLRRRRYGTSHGVGLLQQDRQYQARRRRTSPLSQCATSEKAAAPPPPKPTSKNQERQARRLETEIERAEARRAAIERELADPQAWNDPCSAAKSAKKHAAAKARVEPLSAELETVGG